MTLNAVVLPAPFGPIRPTICPSGTSKETPSRATIPPNRRVTFRSESRAIDRRTLFGSDPKWQRNRASGRKGGYSPPRERAHRRDPRASDAAGQKITNLLGVAIPFAGFLASIFFLWGSYVTWRDLIIFAVGYALTTLGISIGFHRLFTHRSYETFKSDPLQPRRARVDGRAGPGHPLGLRPSQAPQLRRPRGRPALAARRLRARDPRQDRRALARARRLALPQRRPRGVDEVREGPARRPRHGLHLADVPALGRRVADRSRSSPAGSGAARSAPGCRRCSGAA